MKKNYYLSETTLFGKTYWSVKNGNDVSVFESLEQALIFMNFAEKPGIFLWDLDYFSSDLSFSSNPIYGISVSDPTDEDLEESKNLKGFLPPQERPTVIINNE